MEHKKKHSILNNIFFSIKEIAAIDKVYVIKQFIHSIVSAIYSFSAAIGLRIAVSGIENGKDIKTIIIELLIFSLITFLLSLILNILNFSFTYHGYRFYILHGRRIFLKTLDIDYQLYERPETQDLIEKVNLTSGDYKGVSGLFIYTILSFSQILVFITACGIIFTVNFWLIIAILTLAFLKMVLNFMNGKQDKRKFIDVIPPINRKINYCNSISNNFDIGKDLRIYHMNEFIEAEREKSTHEYLHVFAKAQKRNNIYQGLISILSIFDELFLYGFMIYEVIEKNMSIADFTFMISSVRNLTNSLNAIITYISRTYSCSLDVDDYRSFMNFENQHLKLTEEIEDEPVEIEFKNVYYSYYKQEGYALENVSFKINKGEKIGLVGFNGAGKTTIVKLICGLYHPTKGHIYINGKDIETIKRDSLAKLISPVYQENQVLAFSVAENIAMKSKDCIDKEKINKIAKMIDLDKKLESLPNQLDTILTKEFDEFGVELSGGENQKLSLARAMYKDAHLYILDEPTSAMDALSECHMYQNFNQITSNNTTIYISHRLSSTKFCHRILFINKGKIIEEGTHDELMSFDSEYKKLFDTQATYYQDGDEDE